ncbi:CII family transcriptional regulator [Uliginosibacterium sp. sgz301328]|uniref:CII family transcriptional regulator n=1 Tax=Uliginosibacterium sp. sgz301328 TaxID=3243764 RepID=UPI00359D9AE9
MSPEIEALARENESRILQQLARLGQKTVADELGVNSSTVTRMKDADELIPKAARLLAAMGLKVEERDSFSMTRERAIFLSETTAGALLWNANMLRQGGDAMKELENIRGAAQ